MADYPIPATFEDIAAAAPPPAQQAPVMAPPSMVPGSSPGWGDTIKRLIPFVFAGIAGAKGGRVASGAMLNGIASSIAHQNQQAALMAQAEGRQAQFAQQQREKAAAFVSDGMKTLSQITDPAQWAHTADILKQSGQIAFRIPPAIWDQAPHNAPKITAADRKEAQDTLKMLEDKYGPEQVAQMLPTFKIGDRTLESVRALANTTVTNDGQEVKPGLRPRDFTKLLSGWKLDDKTLAALSKAEITSVKSGQGPISESQVNDIITANLTAVKPDKLTQSEQYVQLVQQGKTDEAKALLTSMTTYERALAQARHIAAPGDELTTSTGGGMGLPQMPAGQRDEALLKTLPTGTAVLVKKLADGQMAFPSGFALKSAYWQKLLELTGRYDPSFDAVNYNARYQTRRAFTSGPEAKQVNALNTAIGHLNQLSQAIDALQNKDWQSYNRVANAIATEFGWTGSTDFDTIVKPVADELTRVWRGTGGSESDIQARLAVLQSSRPTGILHSAVAETGHLLQSKIDSLQTQYQQGMGISDIQMLTPSSSQTLQKLEQKAGGATMPSPAGLSPMRPASAHGGTPPPMVSDVPANVKAALSSVGPGRHTLSDGSVWIKDAQGNIRPGGG